MLVCIPKLHSWDTCVNINLYQISSFGPSYFYSTSWLGDSLGLADSISFHCCVGCALFNFTLCLLSTSTWPYYTHLHLCIYTEHRFPWYREIITAIIMFKALTTPAKIPSLFHSCTMNLSPWRFYLKSLSICPIPPPCLPQFLVIFLAYPVSNMAAKADHLLLQVPFSQ